MGKYTGEHLYNSMGAKAAISKAPTTGLPITSKGRVSRACEVCRKRRTKCNGHNPCQRCRSHGLTCEFGDKKVERNSKQIRQTLEQVKDYERLLALLHPKLRQQDAHVVQTVLRKYDAKIGISDMDNGSIDPSKSALSPSTVSDVGDRDTGNAEQMNSFWHTVSDHVEEDLNQSRRARATGLIGKHSEISWLLALKREVEENYAHIWQRKDQGRHDREEVSISSVSYFLDDSIIPIVEDVIPFERPSKEVAMKLIDEYFRVIHPSFPIIAERTFTDQVERFYALTVVRPGRNWLGILNLIFALASHHIQCALLPPGSVHERTNCLKYFSRAKNLCMAEDAILENTSLQQVQVEGLSSFYLLNIGHFNRAWKLCGMALRSSMAMALHLRNEAPRLPGAWKSSRYHVWWSLVTLEVMLCVITGRPLGIIRNFCTAPLIDPETYRENVNINEPPQVQPATISQNAPESTGPVLAQLNSPLCPTVGPPEIIATVYFACYANLLQITAEVVEVLYTPSSRVTRDPHELQTKATQLNAKAEKWQSDLPKPLQCNRRRSCSLAKCYSVNLELHYHSAKLLIGKPFLDSLRRHGDGISGFCLEKASSCLKAAHEILNLFPDDYDRIWLTETARPWTVLHFLLQATTVLFIQSSMSYCAQFPYPKLFLEKSGRWLNGLSILDPAARRAQEVCAMLISRLSVIVNHKEDSQDDYINYHSTLSEG